MALVGNHEKESGRYEEYDKRWRHPAPGEPRYWWSRDEGAVHLVSLSSEHSMRPGSEQHTWLEEDLARAAAPDQRSVVPWIVGAIHEPDYSSGKHGEDRRMMRYLDPLLRKYGVNLMFAGHDHHYERSYPVYDGRRTTSERGALYQPYGFQAEQGGGSSLPDVIRVVVGTGGRRIRDRCDREDYSLTGCIKEHGYGILQADRRQLLWYFVDTAGRLKDAFKLCARPGCELLELEVDGAEMIEPDTPTPMATMTKLPLGTTGEQSDQNDDVAALATSMPTASHTGEEERLVSATTNPAATATDRSPLPAPTATPTVVTTVSTNPDVNPPGDDLDDVMVTRVANLGSTPAVASVSAATTAVSDDAVVGVPASTTASSAATPSTDTSPVASLPPGTTAIPPATPTPDPSDATGPANKITK
mmetsp:Transcript_8678/g.22310  ORF Transcript_8678/g.22310 Transcript_8678/m.22310 type:complete len:417 (-) Transcript_8678:169-1419(-)